jgi:putative hydroxymethylpyrimidine transport system substrate-binding protein
LTLKPLWLALAAAVLLVTAGCGEKSETVSGKVEPHSFELVLDWFPNPDHVAIYEANDKGFFDAAGLRVNARTPSDPAAPIKEVGAGRADLAISYEPEVLLARERGLPVVAVAALVQRPLTSLMATGKEGIRSARDLSGKRVGTAGIPYQSAYLRTILERAGVDPASVKETNVGASLLPAMLSGKVDATLAAFWNVEGVELRRRSRSRCPRGKGPCARAAVRAGAPTIIPVDRLGVPDYDELVLVANSDKLEDKRDDIRLFIGAVAKGAREARRDPGRATEALLRANRDLKESTTRESVRLTLRALFPEKSGRPWGFLDAQQWRAYGAWMFGEHLLERRPDTPSALTNELLPGEGL